MKCEIAENNDGKVVVEKEHCVYLADETGWGVSNKRVKVMAKKGAKHVYSKKPHDQSHKI